MSVIKDLSATLVGVLRRNGQTIGTAESCTGGLLAAALTDIAGASSVFGCGVVVYADWSKASILGLDPSTIARFGAVSEHTAQAMARGALRLCRADFAISLTGIAGPSGGNAEKPVGLVYIGGARANTITCQRHCFRGTRTQIRRAGVEQALRLALAMVQESPP